MPASPADSPLYARLFGDDEASRLISDSAEVRAMLLVEGALAKVQGELGVIPAESAAFLHRASFEVQIDPSALASETAVNGVPVPALVAAFRTVCNAPDHAAFAHWGATSQDIMDSALALRLKRLIELWEGRLDGLLAALGAVAAAHADLPMAARTYGQVATPTSFGAVVAGWGWPLHAQRAALAAFSARRSRPCARRCCACRCRGRRARFRPWARPGLRCAPGWQRHWGWMIPVTVGTATAPALQPFRGGWPRPLRSWGSWARI